MTLDDAITNLECLEQAQEAGLEDGEKDAIKLGREALMAIRTGREDYYEAGGHQLPGETKD